MALIKCEDCQREISTKSKICIYCGCPINGKTICDECNTEVAGQERECPNCGNPLAKTYGSLKLLSFLFPVIGIAFYFLEIDSNPVKAEACIYGFKLNIKIIIVCLIIYIFCQMLIQGGN